MPHSRPRHRVPLHPGRRRARRAAVVGTALAAVVLAPSAVLATVNVGSPGDDVTFARDTDNASNTFIQPPGVDAVQHLSDSDVVFGRLGDDLVGGRAGDDVLVGGPGADVLVGGRGSDVDLGDTGDDVAVWEPGDASETFVGDVGTDTQVVGRLLRDGDQLRLQTFQGRRLPQAQLAGGTTSCGLTPVPPAQQSGEQYLLRIRVGGELSATVRLKDVERVVCPSPVPGRARVADLTRPAAGFADVPLSSLRGVVGAIVAPY